MPELIDVIEVEALEGHRLRLRFEDGRRGVFDVSRFLRTGVFSQLADAKEFATAHIEGGTVAWACGVDIAPERLYADLKDERR